MKWDNPELNGSSERRPPRYATTIAWFQGLPAQWRLTVIYQMMGSMTWRDDRDMMAPSRQTDVRLAYPFRLGATKAEVAFTVQSLEGDRPFFLLRKDFELGRKCFVNLRLEY